MCICLSINPFFDYKTQRDAHEALILLLDIFSNICNLPLKDNKISTVPEFVDSFFSGIYKTSFICQLCQETNIYYEPFHHITVQPNTDIFSYLAKDFRENKNLTCRKCTIHSSQSLCTSYQETVITEITQVWQCLKLCLYGQMSSHTEFQLQILFQTLDTDPLLQIEICTTHHKIIQL